MGIWNNIVSALSGRKAQGEASDKFTPTGFEAYGAGLGYSEASKNREYLNEMHGWVAACTSAIADEIGSIPLHLYKQTSEGIEEITEHPIIDLLYKVNSFTTKFDHFWLTQAFLELTGEAPWYLEKNGKEVTAIYLLRPDKIRPVAGKSRMIEYYEYEIDAREKVKLMPDEVIFLKYPNPSKPFRGIGTLEMAARTVDIDNFSEEWNKKFYENSARPDAILTVNTERLSDEQKQKLKASLSDAYQGIKNSHKVMVLFGDMKFEKSAFSMKDMDFMEQQKFSRDKILGIFKVPKAIVAQTEGVNLASAEVAQYVFARWTIKPKMERLIQQLNEFLLPLFAGTENIFIDFENPVPEDEEKKIKKYESGLKSGWMTINEVRQEQGLPDVEGGDVIYLSGSYNELGADPEKQEPTKTLALKKGAKYSSKFNTDRLHEMRVRGKKYFKIQKTKQEFKEKIKTAIKKEILSEQKAPTYVIKKNIDKKDEQVRILSQDEITTFWNTKNKVFDKYQRQVKDALIKLFTKQRKSVLTKLSKVKNKAVNKSSDDLYSQIKLNEEAEIEKTLTISLPILEQLFKEAGDETYALLNINDVMDISTDEIQELIRATGRVFAKQMTQTTNDFIREQVIDAVGKGESIPQITERIKGVFSEAQQFRAERIARTESLRYNTSATEQAFIDSGIVEGKMWVTDPDPCPYCATLAGKTAKLGENFISKGDTIIDREFDYDDLPFPPLHPNCQCDLIPIFKSKQAIREINNEVVNK